MRYQVLYDKIEKSEEGTANVAEAAEIAAVVQPGEAREIDELRRYAASIDAPPDQIVFTMT
jgi:hypothetical protein